jgi:predicted  nucleic acid-binding Zn-ribbon protein
MAVIAAALIFGVVLVVTLLMAIRLTVERANLPAACRSSELEVSVAGKEAELAQLESKVNEREIALSQRDQAEAEAEYWRSLIESLKAEHAGLEDLRREIEATREDYRRAAEELALKETERRDLRAEVDRATSELETVAARREEAERRIAELEARETEIASGFEGRQREIEALEGRLTELRQEKSDLAAEAERLRERVGGLRSEQEELERESRRLAEGRDALNRETADARARIAAMDQDRAAAEALRAEIAALSQDRDSLRQEIIDIQDEARRLEAKISQKEDRLETLEQEVGQYRTAGSDAGREPDEEAVLEDLRKVPGCFAKQAEQGIEPIWPAAQAGELESEALDRVGRLLRDCGLRFSRRTIYAFHTSLKTAVISPLTVLAGISGTGKSQLPRRYADAMGIHFLKIPVQPRWDSPQDLFGFYNYIETRYKATELARSLVHLDRYNWPEESASYADRMLLVLLDEMNLARVEYYFSEFLSRLEGRPNDAKADSVDERRPAEIDIDVSRKGRHHRVYAGQNVLFVGTMNEDESTLTLSDKVLDRANVLRFPRPPELSERLTNPEDMSRAAGYLPKKRWTESWMSEADKLGDSPKRDAKRHIDAINGILDDLGRPFGHRMSQAMLHYIANYPELPQGWPWGGRIETGLADQVELRIMPKLRGLDVADSGAQLRKLADLVVRELRDEELGAEIQATLDRANTTGIFNWRGCTRTKP